MEKEIPTHVSSWLCCWCSGTNGRSHGSSGACGPIDGTVCAMSSVSCQSRFARTDEVARAWASQLSNVKGNEAAKAEHHCHYPLLDIFPVNARHFGIAYPKCSLF